MSSPESGDLSDRRGKVGGDVGRVAHCGQDLVPAQAVGLLDRL
jgi:hypothetical protein